MNQEEDSGAESIERCALDQENPHTAPRDTHSAEHRHQMRTNVVKEIMNTERIYIKHLRDICEVGGGSTRNINPTLTHVSSIVTDIPDRVEFTFVFLSCSLLLASFWKNGQR